LTWEAVESDGVEGYNVYRDTESIDDVEGMDPQNDSPRSETSYTDESAENRTTYYYVVTSVNTNGNESEPSNEVEKTPFDDPPGRP
jgi:TolB protein